jgi:hypothetical protein
MDLAIAVAKAMAPVAPDSTAVPVAVMVAMVVQGEWELCAPHVNFSLRSLRTDTTILPAAGLLGLCQRPSSGEVAAAEVSGATAVAEEGLSGTVGQSDVCPPPSTDLASLPGL